MSLNFTTRMTPTMLDYSSLLSRTCFIYGRVFDIKDIGYNAIALDGAVQGPQIDAENRRFSLDHHAGCLRLVTKATCEQTREALCLGLPVDSQTKIYINDLDADTVLSVWLLAHPERCWDYRLTVLCAQIGRTDAHGPIFARHPLHASLNPPMPWMPNYRPQSVEMLVDLLAVLDRWWSGEWTEPPAAEPGPVTGWGWNARSGWTPIDAEGDGFDTFYKAGFVLGFLHTPAANGTLLYTVAKASDLVAADLGPGSLKRPMVGPEQAENTILGQLALAENEKNPEQPWAATWGGGTSIGGSPRNAVPEGEAGSVLTPDEVLAVFRRFRP